jgi:hypothetical protein
MIKRNKEKLVILIEIYRVDGEGFLQEGKHNAHIYTNRVNLNVEDSCNYV